MSNDKDEAKQALRGYFAAYQAKNVTKIMAMIAGNEEFISLGTDRAEVLTGRDALARQLAEDFQLFETVSFGEPEHLSVVLSPDGKMATMVFDVGQTSASPGNVFPQQATLRCAFTWVKEASGWKIAQAITTLPTMHKSSAELLEKSKR